MAYCLLLHIWNWVIYILQEVSLLDLMERDPGDVGAYVDEVDSILEKKMVMAAELRRVLHAYGKAANQ